MPTINTVRINVAKSLSSPSSPILAKIAVSAANTADNKAKNSQDITSSFIKKICAHDSAKRHDGRPAFATRTV
jgi:hypothetical protein